MRWDARSSGFEVSLQLDLAFCEFKISQVYTLNPKANQGYIVKLHTKKGRKKEKKEKRKKEEEGRRERK